MLHVPMQVNRAAHPPFAPLRGVDRALLQPQPGQSNVTVPLALLHKGVGSRYRKAELLLRAGTETLLQRVIWFKKLSGH